MSRAPSPPTSTILERTPMTNHPARFALLLVLANAACVDAPPTSPQPPSSPTPLTGTGQTLDSSIWEQGRTDRFRVVLNTVDNANWRVDSSLAYSRSTRRIEVVAGRRCEFLVRSDRALVIEIPAMRVRATVEVGKPTTFWFWPVTPGEYDMLVRSGLDRFDGKLVVVTPQDRTASKLPEAVDEARLAATAALRAELLAVMVEQWRKTGNGEEAMRWLIPIPVEEFAGLDPLLASAERVLDHPAATLAISSESGLLHTRNGVYRFQFVSDKIAAKTYRAVLNPVDVRAGRERITLRWPEAVGRRLMHDLDWFMDLYADEAIPTGETHGGPWFR